MAFVTVYMKDRTSTQVPLTNLNNFKRIMRAQIEYIEEEEGTPITGVPLLEEIGQSKSKQGNPIMEEIVISKPKAATEEKPKVQRGKRKPKTK